MKETKISRLKSHDCHVILKHLLPLTLRGLLVAPVRESLIQLSMFFDILQAKELTVDDLEQIEAQIPLTLCKLEKAFRLAFFNALLHLSIHLVRKAKIESPIQFTWMYPIEQVMYTFKSYVRNRTRPEASIQKGYLVDECMTLCSRYLHSLETKFNCPHRNYEIKLRMMEDYLPLIILAMDYVPKGFVLMLRNMSYTKLIYIF